MTAAVVLGLLAGCSSKRPSTGQAAGDYGVLQEVNDMLHAASSKRPPAKLADLNRYKGMFSVGYEAVKSGEIVVLWGTPVQGEGNAGKDAAVLAYQKQVPTEGGYVLMSAGSIKKMTPDQFNAAKEKK
jgi:hypothetical protein